MTFQEQKVLVVRSFTTQLKQFPRRLLQVLAYIGVGGLAFYIPSRMEIELDLAIRLTLFIAIAFAFNKVVEKYIPQKYVTLFHLLFLPLALFLAIPSVIQLGTFIVFIFVIPWFLIMFNAVIRSLFTEEIPVGNLHPNMIPAERIVKIEAQNLNDRYVKIPAGFANPAQDNVIVDVSSEGLTSPQIEQLHQLAAAGSLKEYENKLLHSEKNTLCFDDCFGNSSDTIGKWNGLFVFSEHGNASNSGEDRVVFGWLKKWQGWAPGLFRVYK